MVIRRSSVREITRLIADLGGDNAVAREAATARLAVIGGRAVDRLVRALATESRTTVRVGLLRSLEAIDDARALSAALSLLGASEPEVALAAVGVTRGHLRSRMADAAVAALDRLTALALDSARSAAVRIAAIEALEDLPALTIRPILATLRDDSDPAVRSHVSAGRVPAKDVLVRTAADGHLPEDPESLRTAVVAAGMTLPLAVLQRLVDQIRARELDAPLMHRGAWTVVRAAVHQVLAARGSRIAMYDLRDTIAAADAPLPVGFVAAVAAVGDASCLKAIARSYAGPAAQREPWWREHLADAFREILRRERLTRRHAVIKRLVDRWPAAARTLLRRR